jgi:hypothetical protein
VRLPAEIPAYAHISNFTTLAGRTGFGGTLFVSVPEINPVDELIDNPIFGRPTN